MKNNISCPEQEGLPQLVKRKLGNSFNAKTSECIKNNYKTRSSHCLVVKANSPENSNHDSIIENCNYIFLDKEGSRRGSTLYCKNIDISFIESKDDVVSSFVKIIHKVD